MDPKKYDNDKLCPGFFSSYLALPKEINKPDIVTVICNSVHFSLNESIQADINTPCS